MRTHKATCEHPGAKLAVRRAVSVFRLVVRVHVLVLVHLTCIETTRSPRRPLLACKADVEVFDAKAVESGCERGQLPWRRRDAWSRARAGGAKAAATVGGRRLCGLTGGGGLGGGVDGGGGLEGGGGGRGGEWSGGRRRWRRACGGERAAAAAMSGVATAVGHSLPRMLISHSAPHTHGRPHVWIPGMA